VKKSRGFSTAPGVALDLETGVPSFQVEDEEGRIHLLLYLTVEDENEDRWSLWRPDQAGFASRSILMVRAGEEIEEISV
jgi:hypothetical protein